MSEKHLAAIAALEEQVRSLKTQLSVESRKLTNARYLNESYEKQVAEAQLAARLAEARAHRSEAKLQDYEQTQEVHERTRKMAKLAKSLSDGGAELVAAEGMVRTCISDPAIKHPIAGLARRRELTKLQAKVDQLSRRFESEKELMKSLQDVENNQNELWLAATQNNLKVLERQIRAGCSVNATDLQGYSALAYGCKYGHVDVVRLCLDNGANLASEHAMHTPLILATQHSHAEVVKMLLEAGADVDGVDGSGHTALHMAAEAGLVPMMELLLESGAAVDCLNAHGATPLHVATQALKLISIQTLMRYGASASRRDLHGRNPSEMIPELPESRSNVSIKDAEDNAAAKQERTDILRLISAHIAENDTRTVREDESTISSKATIAIRPKRDRSTVPRIPAATLHLTRAEQRSLTRTNGEFKKSETLRVSADKIPPTLTLAIEEEG